MRFLAAVYVLASVCSLSSQTYPPPLDLGPTNSYGRHLQRSLRLMQESPPAKKRTVKVLLYGQSITQQRWTIDLSDYLRQRYTNANLVITNMAIGYVSDVLVRPAETDIAGFYPDLMIFQDYGADNYYENILQFARQRTTTDILIQTDHINYPEDLPEPTDPATPGGLPPRALHNYVTLPAFAQRYGAELADLRTYWKDYLNRYNIKTVDLLSDVIHPNPQGNYLFTELLKPYFRTDPSFPSDEWADAEKDYLIGRDLDWSGNTLQLDFTGNRVDAVIEQSGDSPIQVRIDGQKPSTVPELYHFTRADWYPGTYWLTILKMQSERPLIEEDWTAKILEFTTNQGTPFARFSVTGSQTGFDGEGNINERFVSLSQRVILEPVDWVMIYWASAYYPQLSPLPVGFETHWKALLNARDEFLPVVTDSSLETTITLAQGLANGHHTLELTRTGDAPISAIRVYNPLARVQPARIEVRLSNTHDDQNNFAFEVSSGGRYLIESSDDCHIWTALTAPLEVPQLSLPMNSVARFYRARAID